MISKRRSKMFIRLSIVYCLITCLPVFALVKLPVDMHELALSSIQNVYNGKFKQAESAAKRIIKKYPDHPAGYFFFAAVQNSYMEYLQSEKYEIEFYHYCDLAIAKGEELLEKDPDNVWAKFFLAGANGIKGTYESRYKRWLTAFKHGWRGVVLLKELLETNPEMADAFYGIATYDYWRSDKTKLLWWLPGIEDKRESAIKILYEVQTTGIYVKESASINLIDILYNEEKYSEVLDVTNKMLEIYPSNLICMWGKAKAQLGLEEFDKAEKSYKFILNRIESESFDNNYNAVLCHYYLSKVYFYQQRYKLCIKECTIMKSFKLSHQSEKRLEDYLDNAASMERKARRSLAKKK